MRQERTKKEKRYSHKCADCGKDMTKNSKEYFCPKCGLTEELIYENS